MEYKQLCIFEIPREKGIHLIRWKVKITKSKAEFTSSIETLEKIVFLKGYYNPSKDDD